MVIVTPASTADRERAARRLAARQHGAIEWRQLRAEGIPSSTLSDWCERERLIRVYARSYVFGGTPITTMVRRSAALLTAGTDAYLIGRAALDVHGGTRFRSDAITIGAPRRPRLDFAGVDVRASSAAELGHVTLRDHLRVTTMAWTITDLGADLEPEQIANVIHEALLRRRVTMGEIEHVLSVRRRVRKRAVVRAALDMRRAGSAGTKSGFEDTVYGWVKQLVRHPPYPNVHIAVGDQSFEIDVPFARHRLCIEVDGPLHDDPVQQAKDRIRDAALRAAGYRVVRLHWSDIKFRPARTRARLARELAERGIA